MKAPRSDVFMPVLVSALIPGLGYLLRKKSGPAMRTMASGIFLFGMTWITGNLIGMGSGILFGMLVLLPWWCLQAYEVSLLEPPGLWGTLQIVWAEGHDIRYLGALFFLTAFTDLYIILANPNYALTIFCTKPTGLMGVAAKIQSPTLHIAIGYGFLRLRRWSLFVYMAYAGFGLLNATVNLACIGYGRIRTVFLITLAAFTIYVFIRRRVFVHTVPSMN